MDSSAPWNILLTVPPMTGVESGNHVTARRWAEIFSSLGYRVGIQNQYRGESCDLMVALHAGKSFAAASRFKGLNFDVPLIVALTGTDLYRDLGRDPRVDASLRLADRVVVLQKDAATRIPAQYRAKVRVIYQSVEPHLLPVVPCRDSFQICLLGHLRAEKDLLRAAQAVRSLPTSSRIQVVHAGAALEPDLGAEAEKEMRHNVRYHWLGPLSHRDALTLLCRSHLLCIPSRMEGSSNALSEAVVNRIPVVTTKIPGLEGTLGPDYPGYFPAEETDCLRRILLRAEQDAEFYGRLKAAGLKVRHLLAPRREREAWRNLLSELFDADRFKTGFSLRSGEDPAASN